jgi:hypothetical protein
VIERQRSFAPVAAWMIVAACVVTAAAAAGIPFAGADYDSGIYLDLARSLATGHGYRHLLLPGAPHGVHFPPLYPAVLAPWLAVGPHTGHVMATIAWAAALNRILIVLAVGFWVAWAVRERLGVWGAAMMGALAFTPYAASYSVSLYAEPLCWALLGGAALCLSGVRDEGSRAARAGCRAGALVLLALLPLARTALLPFTLAAAFWLWRDRRTPAWRRWSGALLVLAPTLGWIGWGVMHAHEIPVAWRLDYGPYLAVVRAAHFSAGDWIHLAGLQFTGGLIGLGLAIAPIAWGGVLAGGALGSPFSRVRTLWPLALGALGSVLVLAAWPAVQTRFYAAIVPVVLAVGAAGMPGFLERDRRGDRRRIGALPWVALGALSIGWLALVVQGQIGGARAIRAMAAPDSALVSWIRARPDDTPIAAEREPELALRSGHAIYPAGELNPRSALDRTPYLRFSLSKSLCTVARGWLLVSDTSGALGAAWRTLAARADSPVSFGMPEQVGEKGEAVMFRCRAAPVSSPQPLATGR